MRGIMAVFKKEILIAFSSPIFYAASFIFLVVSGYFFYTNAIIYTIRSFQAGQNPFLAERLNLSDFVVKPFFGDIAIVLLFMLPLLTMRSYAEEKKWEPLNSCSLTRSRIKPSLRENSQPPCLPFSSCWWGLSCP